MKCLVDANVILEVILERKNVVVARQFLALTTGHEFFISDYALHSIGTFLFRLKKKAEFLKLLGDLERNKVTVLVLYEKDLGKIVEVSDSFSLDFDDAYQYTVAEKYDLTIVSFDKDFDRTKRGRKTPSEILKG